MPKLPFIDLRQAFEQQPPAEVQSEQRTREASNSGGGWFSGLFGLARARNSEEGAILQDPPEVRPKLLPAESAKFW
eukprot:scaffold341261_cov43-Prasinocladus_malaysianus.AAC.1